HRYVVCLFYQSYRHHPDLHSFPTRRSSDLAAGGLEELDEVPNDAMNVATTSTAAVANHFSCSRSSPTDPRNRTPTAASAARRERSEEHTSELQSRSDLVCRLLLEKKKKKIM